MTADRVTGTVLEFYPRKGSGYIKPKDGDEKDKVFVHWKNIESDDAWPALEKDMEVEYEAGTDEKKKSKKVALKVTKVGGGKIALDGNKDKNYDPSETVHKGTVKFFDKKKGFGFIVPEEDLEFDGKKASKKGGEHLQVGREDIITEGEICALDDGAKVEFVLYTSEKGDRLSAGKVTGPDRAPVEFKGTKKRGREDGKKWSPNKKQKTNERVEVGLFVQQKHVGTIIGKGAKDIKKLQFQTKCDRIQFGKSKIGKGDRARCVLSIHGWPNCVAKAIKRIAKQIAELEESEEKQITFLIPSEYAGMFMGKKASFVKNVTEGEAKLRVLKNHVQLPGASEVALAALKGPDGDFQSAIHPIIDKLALISSKVREDAKMLQMQMGMMGGMMRMATGGGGGRRQGGGWSNNRRQGGGGWKRNNRGRRW